MSEASTAPARPNQPTPKPTPLWIEGDPQPDTHATFHGTFVLDREAIVHLRMWGASWFVASLDGAFAAEGPTRREAGHHEAVAVTIKLPAGKHQLAAHVNHAGVPTRMMTPQTPFFACLGDIDGKPIDISWRASHLAAYAPRVRRINPQLGWIEWCDTRQLPKDDADWKPPRTIDIGPAEFSDPQIGAVRQIVLPITAFSEDKLVERFGYELDDIPARFLLRDLHPKTTPPQGVWRRYDLDRIRLGRLSVTIDAPPGAVVEMAYAEALMDGRVAPHVSLSTGPSCNFDHYVARGGEQEFLSLTPKGGRFVEVHVLADPAKIKFGAARYLERSYHGRPIGSFECDDALLNRIWLAGVETYRACSEDAIIDNPTRERGQWTGDAFIGMETASVAYDDLRLARHALVAAAADARGDGLVSGLTPGHTAIASYAVQWVSACTRYYTLTGDRALLAELYEPASKNLAAFDPFVTPDGLTDGMGWAFIDWGYARPDGPIDPALNFYYLGALRAMVQWAQWLQKPGELHIKRLERQQAAMQKYLADRVAQGWEKMGYHVAALAHAAGLLDEHQKPAALEFIRKHILNCFPNNPSAPRLSDPSITSKQIITPFFAHHAFGAMYQSGQADFILDQYRTCWGWMFSEGVTTLMEVFDPRWSHCHQWSACPTWQLSRFVLGLHPRFDRTFESGDASFDLLLKPGSLKRASGVIPIAGGGTIDVKWKQDQDGIAYSIKPSKPIKVLHGKELLDVAGPLEIRINAD